MPAFGSVRTGFFQSVVGFAVANRHDTGWGTRRLPHPIAPKPSGPLTTHVDPGRRAGHAYGGRGRNCQGKGLSAFMIASCAASAAKHFNLPLPANLPI